MSYNRVSYLTLSEWTPSGRVTFSTNMFGSVVVLIEEEALIIDNVCIDGKVTKTSTGKWQYRTRKATKQDLVSLQAAFNNCTNSGRHRRSM